MTEELLNMKAIGTRVGRSYATVRGWRMLGQMPAPDVQVGSIPLWHASTIDTWWAAKGEARAPGSDWEFQR